MKLHTLPSQKRSKKKRIGRGYGSGKGGHTVGKGQKGQRSRSGFSEFRAWVRETKVRSLPKLRGIGKRKSTRGYVKQGTKSVVLNVRDLQSLKAGTTIDRGFLESRGFFSGRSKKNEVKILGGGKLAKKIIVKGIAVSASAREKIEKVGGKVLESR